MYKKRFSRPTDPNIFRHVTGNTHIFFRPQVKQAGSKADLAIDFIP